MEQILTTIEKKGMKIYHVYDLSLNTLINQLDQLLSNSKLFENYHLSKEQYSDLIQEIINCYCESEKIELGPQTILVRPSAPSYGSFLALGLAFQEIPKIQSYLSYQMKIFGGNTYAIKQNFVGMLEHQVYPQVKNLSLESTNRRLEKIMEWVIDERRKVEEKGQKLKTLKLIWNGGYDELTVISERIYDAGYTDGRDKFKNVFQGRHCKWLRDPEVVAHIICSLYKCKKISVSEGKGYLKVASLNFSDYSSGQAKEIQFAKLNYTMVNRPAKKHINMLKLVNELIKVG